MSSALMLIYALALFAMMWVVELFSSLCSPHRYERWLDADVRIYKPDHAIH